MWQYTRARKIFSCRYIGGEVKVNLSLYFSKHYAMKIYLVLKHHTLQTYGGSGFVFPCIFNLGTQMVMGGQLHASSWFSPGTPTHRILGGPQSRSGRRDEDKSPCPCQESNPGLPARSLVTVLNEVPRLTLRKVYFHFMKDRMFWVYKKEFHGARHRENYRPMQANDFYKSPPIARGTVSQNFVIRSECLQHDDAAGLQ
jgi:hypothetical protein